MSNASRDLADRVAFARDKVVVRVTDQFLERHPDWVARYGSRAREHGEKDAAFHVDHLAGALLADSVEAFADYARWTTRVIASRGIEPIFLDENLDQVGSSLEAILGAGDGARIRQFIEAGRLACREPITAPGNSASENALSGSLRVYMTAALLGDRRAAMTVVDEALANGADWFALYRDLLQEALYETGRLWERTRVTVAQEHTATAVTQFVLAQLYNRLPRPARSAGSAVVTGVPGDRHGIGSQMVADTLEMHGWQVRYLGTDLPAEGVASTVRESGATLVAVSATLLSHLPAVAEVIAQVRRATPGPLRILVGGSAFRPHGEGWSTVGADAYGRDLDAVVSLASATSTANR